VLIKRLYLRNFRVYEDELDLDLPPGLVGIYGPNGSGKSTLLEAILWTLWGKSRTTKEQIRSSGVGGECLTEVEFEHEGHLYLIRRTLKGINAAVSVEAHCDGALMSSGTRDAQRYVESVLGMDDAAFRASVFTEQKQLAAFSDQPPSERRKLVLQLLGITPLDGARDAARKDARDLTADHDRLRGMLVDLTSLEVEVADAEAKADAAEMIAQTETKAAEAAEARLAEATAAFEAVDRKRQQFDSLVQEGKAARQELDTLQQLVEQRQTELAELDVLSARLSDLEPAAAGLADLDAEVPLLQAAASAASALERLPVADEPPVPDTGALEAARARAASLREQLAAEEALVRAASDEVKRAKEVAARSSSLSGEADCPICGQSLGSAFEKVQAHRAGELRDAETRLAAHQTRRASLAVESGLADAEAAKVESQVDAARRLRADWERSAQARAQAEESFADAWQALLTTRPDREAMVSETRPVPAATDLLVALEETKALLVKAKAANDESLRARAKLESRPRLTEMLQVDSQRRDAARSNVEVLLEKAKALSYDRGALEGASQARDAAGQAARDAAERSRRATIEAATARERGRGAAQRLEEGRQQHGKLAGLESDARHVSRVADLLGEFRNTVVATVGPRLAVQAAELFAELTDHEYDRLDVNPETYQLQISDAGQLYGLERFSGSEIDLANLALRVAISEHIHFQSGGSVGLLVLDEVFGPLDEDRKARMLLALERLRGRFRQVLVVTHDSEIKEQLPNAIEVVKLPGRRATARVVGD
jgi:exonuclease SbcC